MIHCNQVCMYNFSDDGCLKPKDAVCPLSNIARDTNVLTNADHIRSMTDEELAELLLDGVAEKVCPNGCDGCDSDCEGHFLNWLKQPYEEK